ncbi:hypothetical protein Q0M94_05050 [Deinococcus radiomollis]|uniref:hypothetical protein n=1 Tax=Deinococcus radiomollis TaxID=468916 RepID=UPI0038920520
MNRVAKLTALTFASFLTLAPLASAQQSGAAHPGAAQPGSMPMRAGQGMPAGRMPVALALARKVDSLNVIGKDPTTAFTQAQATQLLALLEPLRTAKTLTDARATSVSASIDQILTPAQRPALRLAESQMGGGRPQGGQMQGGQMQGGRPQGQGGQMQGGQPQGGQMRNGQMKGGQPQGQRAQGGQMSMAPGANPFLSQRGSQILGTLLTSLRK